jgi:hypothetical protein
MLDLYVSGAGLLAGIVAVLQTWKIDASHPDSQSFESGMWFYYCFKAIFDGIA